MLADTLRETSYADEQAQNRIIQTLAENPEITIDEAIKAAYTLYSKGPWQLAVRLIVAMGYPRNELAIERFIDNVSDDRMAPYIKLYVTALNEIGVQIVTPHLIRTMLDTSVYQDPKYHYQTRKDPMYGRFLDIEGIFRYIIPSNILFARLCGPTLAYLLAQVVSIPELGDERSFFLSPFQKLGAECATYALPALIGMVQKWGLDDEDGQEAMELIQTFPKEALEPYKYLLASLQKPNQEHTSQ